MAALMKGVVGNLVCISVLRIVSPSSYGLKLLLVNTVAIWVLGFVV